MKYTAKPNYCETKMVFLKVSTNKRSELDDGVNLSFQHPSDDSNQVRVKFG